MAEKTHRRNLGRGLSALIPDVDMDFLSQIVRDDSNKFVAIGKNKSPVVSVSGKKALTVSKTVPNSKQKPKTVDKAANSHKTSDIKIDLSSNVSAKAKPATPVVLSTGKVVEQTSKLDKDNLLARNGGLASGEIAEDLSAKIEFVETRAIEANPYQPRRFFSPQELEDLVRSLREHGVLQPIILRPAVGSTPAHIKYQLIAGERRWRAAQTAGLNEIPAIIREVTDQQALELALIENVQRHDISALDAAIAYRRLSQEFSLSTEQVAQRVGKSRSSVANTIRLLDLPAEAQKAIEEELLSEGHGRAILLTPTDGARRAVLRRVLRDKLSVRATEELARQVADADADENDKSNTNSSDGAPLKQVRLSPEARRIEEGLQKHLGTRVKLKMRRQGGQILVHYFSNEELERLLKLIIK